MMTAFQREMLLEIAADCEAQAEKAAAEMLGHKRSMLLLRHVYVRSFGTLFLPFPHCVHCVCLCGLAPSGEGPPNPRASAASERGPTVVRGAGHR